MPGDPFYERKAVPDALIRDVGYTGLSTKEELESRERKYSRDGGDLRKFSNPKSGDKLDPHYARKQVPDELIQDVGYTGLSREQEFDNRERKYSVQGSDIRKFSEKDKGWHPTEDPYYGRKAVDSAHLEGVGELPNMTPAQQFLVREQKEAAVDLSSDPFAEITGRGHRASIVDPSQAAYASSAQQQGQRRRSSAVAPHHAHHSGYDGDDKLAPVESRTEDAAPTNGATTVRDATGHATGPTGHTEFYDAATKDLDSVAPHENR